MQRINLLITFLFVVGNLQLLAQGSDKDAIQYSSEMHPSWSPSNEELVFFSDASGNDKIYTISIKTGEKKQLTKGEGTDGNPTWSPTGEYIAFHSNRHGKDDIFMIKPDGTGLKRLTSNPYSEISPAWSPDGRKLVYSADLAGNWQLFTVDIESSQTHQLTKGGEDHLSPEWSLEADMIYFSVSHRGAHQTDVEIQKLDLNSNTHTALTRNSGVTSNVSVSPRSNKIIFNSLRDGDWEIYSMDFEGKNSKRLTSNSEKRQEFEFSNIDGQPAISKDGQRISFLSGRDGSFDIYTMKIDGSDLINLTRDWVKDN